MKDNKYTDIVSSENDNEYMLSEPKSWGGTWTKEKLDAFEKYVNAYLTIMNKYRDTYKWKLIYLDGFAGSGTRGDEQTTDTEFMSDLFKDELFTKSEIDVYKGAAERVMRISQRGFDYYYFIDKDKTSSDSLHNILMPLQKEKQILEFRNDDANQELEAMANAMRMNNGLKALVLLDPFGMQVRWKSIEILKGLGVDIWILLPTGVIINRLLDKKGELKHINILESTLGLSEEKIKNIFFKKSIDKTFFGNLDVIHKIENPIEKISNIYVQKLHDIFDNVTDVPLVLRNSKNTPIYHFVFASNNKNAVNIAQQIISKKQH